MDASRLERAAKVAVDTINEMRGKGECDLRSVREIVRYAIGALAQGGGA